MRRAVVEGRTPNLFLVRYDPVLWNVRSVILIPFFAFSLSCIEKRKPLAATARRKHWVGCHIVLSSIPTDARIPLVREGVPTPPDSVRAQYRRLRPLEELNPDARGWALDVLNVVRSLGRKDFSLSDLYLRAEELQRLHPKNLHVREKIRQQLQRLRDLGLISFLGRGTYTLKFD
jgi:type II restriction enzyme